MCLVAEIVMLVFGILALIKGKFSLTRSKVVPGTPARIIGVILILPLPIAFLIGLVVGAALAARGEQMDARTAAKFIPIEGGLVVVAFTAAIIIALATARPPRKRRRVLVQDEYEEEFQSRQRGRRDEGNEDEDRQVRRRHADDSDEPPHSPKPDRRFRDGT